MKISKGGNQNPYIEEEPTTQWPKKKDKQRSTKHTHKTKDLVTQAPQRIGDELMCYKCIATLPHLSDTHTLYILVFDVMFSEMKSKVIVHVGDIDGIVDHHCLTFFYSKCDTCNCANVNHS